MSFLFRLCTLTLLSAVTLVGARAHAENEGQDDLDRATVAKVVAKSETDMGEVIRLAESALEKGLDEENGKFAKNLLGATLIQRGAMRSSAIFQGRVGGSEIAQRAEAAWDDLKKGIELIPNHPQAHLQMARLDLLPGGSRDRASKALGRAIELLDDEPKLKARALSLRAGITEDPERRMADLDEAARLMPNDAAVLRARALTNIAQQKYEAALKDLNGALEIDPEHAKTHELTSNVLAMLKRYDEAHASLDKVRKLRPDSAAPLVQKARIHLMQQDGDAALADLNEACRIEPENVLVLLARAGLHQNASRGDKAMADVDRALKLRPGLPAAIRFRAMLLAAAGKLDEAIADVEELHRRVPKDLTATLQLATLYSGRKRYDEAVELYTAVLAERPDHWGSLLGRGDALLNSGKHSRAIADYEATFKKQPKDPHLLNNLAWVLATSPVEKLRDGERAVQLATEACELTDHKQAHILSTLAAGYAESGDFTAAVKWAEKAVEIGDEDQLDPLKAELESFRAGKPWREDLSKEPPKDEELK